MAALADALLRGDERIITLVGAGGKTSLMFLLARALCAQGHRVITTTTTRIRVPDRGQSPAVLLRHSPDFRKELDRALRQGGQVTLADRELPGQKLAGLASSDLEEILAGSAADRMIVEADGARTLPLKAPGGHEPVVPEGTDLFIAVVGLDCLKKPLTDEVAFRPERVANLTGTPAGAVITAETVARLAVHPQGLLKGCPRQARGAVFFNKTDLVPDRRAMEIIALAEGLPGRQPDFWLYGSVQGDSAVRIRNPRGPEGMV